MSDEAKAKFMANMAKKAEHFKGLPEETQAKIKGLIGSDDFKEKALALHKDFFEKADANKDGMLSQDEYLAYMKLWDEDWKSKGVELPFLPDFLKESWEARRVSGKEGVTNEDLMQCTIWEEEAKKALMG